MSVFSSVFHLSSLSQWLAFRSGPATKDPSASFVPSILYCCFVPLLWLNSSRPNQSTGKRTHYTSCLVDFSCSVGVVLSPAAELWLIGQPTIQGTTVSVSQWIMSQDYWDFSGSCVVWSIMGAADVYCFLPPVACLIFI